MQWIVGTGEISPGQYNIPIRNFVYYYGRMTNTDAMVVVNKKQGTLHSFLSDSSNNITLLIIHLESLYNTFDEEARKYVIDYTIPTTLDSKTTYKVGTNTHSQELKLLHCLSMVSDTINPVISFPVWDNGTVYQSHVKENIATNFITLVINFYYSKETLRINKAVVEWQLNPVLIAKPAIDVPTNYFKGSTNTHHLSIYIGQLIVLVLT